MDDIMEKIVALVKKKMRESGEYGQEAYREFVEEALDFYVERGEIGEDENLEMVKDQLDDLWEPIEGKMADD